MKPNTSKKKSVTAKNNKPVSPLTVIQLFEEQAKNTPNHVAIYYEGKTLSYKELDEKSNQLARHIRQQYLQKTNQSFASNTLIAICCDRGPEMIIGLLGILKSGGAYLPLDPAYPKERTAYILKDACVSLVLTQRPVAETASFFLSENKLLYIDPLEEFYQTEDVSALNFISKATDLAYVIYTSGTTGLPKGVMLEHKGITNLVYNQKAHLEIAPASRVLQFASLVFDASVWEIFSTLCFGAELFILPATIRQNPLLTIDYLETHRISIATLPPALLSVLPYKDLPELKTLVIAGESCAPEFMNKWCKNRKLINAYGPTEGTVCATLHHYKTGDLNKNIGKPLSNVFVYVLDDTLNAVPIGSTGELYIGGAGLARGYLNRPELTDSRFIDNPFATKEDFERNHTKLYKTGDIVRWATDGTLEFIGRNDDQVKIRGYRIEPGEVEQALSQIPGVGQCCVIARKRKTEIGSGNYLAAYYTLDNNDKINEDDVIKQLAQVLPEYMLPSAIMVLETFPLTMNGKIDKQALPEPGFETAEQYVQPETPLEKELTGLLEDVLGIKKVSCTANFFELGGNSLLASMFLARIRNTCQIDVPMKSFLTNPTARGLAAVIPNANADASVFLPPKKLPRSENADYQLSYPQLAIWTLNEISPVALAYNAQYSIIFEGTLDIGVLEEAINELIKRHESLRTTFHSVDANPVQKIHPAVYFKMGIHSFEELNEADKKSALHELRSTCCRRKFDLTSFPLFSWDLAILDAFNYELIIVEHHFVHDGWSVVVLLNELKLIYTALLNKQEAPLEPLRIQMVDFAAWQRELLKSPYAGETLDYWKDKLSDFTYLSLHADFPVSQSRNYMGQVVDAFFPAADYEHISVFAKRAKTSSFLVMLSAFKAFLYKYTGETDITLGSTTANRRMKEFESLIGMCVNTLVLRTKISGDASFYAVIELVKDTVYGSQHYQDLPFELLVKQLAPEREVNRNPFFSISFNFHDSLIPEIQWPGIKGKMNYLSNNSAKFDISVIVIPPSVNNPEGIVRFEYATDLFKEETIRKIIDRYFKLLRDVIANPYQTISSHSIIEEEEKKTALTSWNASFRNYTSGKTICDLFVEQVQKTPNNTALVFREQHLTYKELHKKTNQLAATIRKHYQIKTGQPLGADAMIVLCLDRSVEMVIAILAVLKAGGAYVPMDTAYPKERMDHILKDTETQLILTHRHLHQKNAVYLPEEKTLYIDLSEQFYLQEEDTDLPTNIRPSDLAYVIYTSGTTGQPKGVMVEHGTFAQFIFHFNEYLFEKTGIQQPDMLSLTNYVFDIFGLEYALPLITGAKLTLSSLDKLTAEELLTHQIIQQTPSALLTIATNFPEKLAQLTCLVGGEALIPSVADKLIHVFDSVFNVYGPAETVIWSSIYEVKCAEEVYIGRPLYNEQLYILDTSMNLLPAGVTGEIYIGGAGVARGYLNRPALTAERFVPNPFDAGKSRLYKTGDLARWLPDGNIEYIGRNDDQVKIRGYRIELAEIEHALSQVAGIHQCCVLAKQRKTESGLLKYLAAYYIPDRTSKVLTPEYITARLSQILPEYMVPVAFLEMENFPLTVNGKLNKRAFPEPDFHSETSASAHVKPVNEMQKELCKIWQEVLGLKRVGITDDFFKIGGDSILAIQVSHKMSMALDREIKVADVFKYRCIDLLSKSMDVFPETVETVRMVF